ncbi:hypothetical protein QE152_g23715 [Popillia japonica]|uniref:Uncharacterized protein n=1 Tax=Popillia japonica TaxID=7064 RepID=A0AAW1KGE5_POPJA
MSKKSTDRCCDSDTDSKSTTTYGRNCGSNSIPSTLSSARDGSLRGPSGDHDCSTCSSTYSSNCSSPYRSNLLTNAKKETQDISMYLDRLKMYRKQLNLSELQESTCNAKVNKKTCGLPQPRRPISAPVFTTKKLSSNSCKLQSIDEKEEQDCKSTSTSAVSSQKCLNDPVVTSNSNREYEENVKITPRCIEVPPKKLCVRTKTPEVVNHSKNIPPELSSHIETGWKVHTDSHCEHYANKTCTGKFVKDAHSNFIQCQESSSASVNLPQSVEELVTQPAALEPNIIIIKGDEEKKKKWRHRKKRSGAIGDMSSDSGKSKENEEVIHQLTLFLQFTLIVPLEDYIENAISSRSYTPTYVVSTIYSDSTLQSNAKKSDLGSSLDDTPRYYSNTEIIEREIQVIDRDSVSALAVNKELEHFHDVIDVRSYKSMLMDYSSGIQPTKTFPIHFDDLEKLENKDEDADEITFKQKASECLQSVKSQQISGQLDQLRNNIEMERRSQASKNGSIIDMRKSQKTNLNYYLVGSSSESSIVSEADDRPRTPGIKPEEIQWDREEESRCCSCFASLRLL